MRTRIWSRPTPSWPSATVTAQPASAGGQTPYFSWFDRVSSPGFEGDNVHVIDPGSTAANVTVTIPGCSVQTGSVQPGAEQYFTCATGYGWPRGRLLRPARPRLAASRVLPVLQ